MKSDLATFVASVSSVCSLSRRLSASNRLEICA